MIRSILGRTALAATVAVAAITISAPAAQAQRLNFAGAAQVSTVGTTTSSVLIDFLSGLTDPITPGAPSGNVFATPTIDPPFAPSIVSGTRGTIADLTTTTTSFASLPIANFVQFGAYTFSLTSAPAGSSFGPVTLVNVGGTGTSAFFGVRGVVTGGVYGMAGANYEGVFTLQFAGRTPDQVLADIARPGGISGVAVSSEFLVTSVIPEPSTYALLATGLGALGLTAARRRRSNV